MAKITVQQFKKDFVKKFEQMFAYDYKEGTEVELFTALGYVVKNYYMENWKHTIEEYKDKEKNTNLLFLNGIFTRTHAKK